MMTEIVYCVDLATTGQPLDALVLAGVGSLIAGLTITLLARPRRGRTILATALMMLILAAGPVALDSHSSSAHAGGPDCVTPGPTEGIEPISPDPDPASSPLVIYQISTISGLAPDADPKPIVGRIVNRGPVDVYVMDVTVSIVSVTKATDAAAGVCDSSDYLLQAVRMPVGVVIPAGGSTLFSGASIAFMNKPSTNQDACQGAVVGLFYVST